MAILSALRALTSFTPPRSLEGPVPWQEIAELAIRNGVGPLASYNLEYRMGGGGAPSDVRDRMLGIYQGSLSDNVFKLVNLRRVLGEVDDLQGILLEASAYADAIYPHIAFRPVPELRVLVREEAIPKLVAAGRPMGFRLESQSPDVTVLADNRTHFLFFTRVFGESAGATFDEMYERAIPAKAFGRQMRRPAIEDALLTHVALLAHSGFDAALIEFVDMRELILGAPNQGGTWDRPPDAAELLERAERLGISRALYCAMTLLAHFFPAVQAEAAALTPEVGMAMRALLGKLVIEPAKDLGRETVSVAADQVRKVLMGGG